MSIKGTLCIIVLAASSIAVFNLLTPSAAFAGEGVYRFPDIRPELSLYGGYRVADRSGSNARAGEFEYLKDSVVLGGEYIAFPFPHRLHLEIDVENSKDYFTDLNYAYTDVVLSRWVGRSVHHNLENFTLKDLGPSPAYTVDRRDEGEAYGVTTRIDTVFLRFKTRNYPLHFYMDADRVEKKGDVQQRFLGGSGWFNDLVRTSENKDIDWITEEVTIGTNSHLGPVEVDISHSVKNFGAEGERLDSETYSLAQNPWPPFDIVRAAGTYPHSLTPDLEGSTTTLKAHTSYTGKIVASLTLSKAERENNDSGAKADYFTGAGDLMLSPFSALMFAIKYRHRENDIDNPDSLPAGYLGFSSYTSETTGTSPSISSKSDAYSAETRYRVTRTLSLKAGYSHKETERTDTEEKKDVLLPGKTSENTFYLATDARLPKKIKLRVKYEHSNVSSPAYNTDPERADSGLISFTWTPLAWLRAFLGYRISVEDRDKTSFGTDEAGDRMSLNNRFNGRLTFLVAEKASINAGYTFLRNRVEQEANFGAGTSEDVQYKDTAQNFNVGLGYSPAEEVRMSANVSHTKSKGAFLPDVFSVSSLSELKARETQYALSGEFGLGKGLGVGLRYEFTDFENLHEDPDNPTGTDGTAQVVMLTATKKW